MSAVVVVAADVDDAVGAAGVGAVDGVVVVVVVVAVVAVDEFDDLEMCLIETAWISNLWQHQKSFQSLCF